MRHGPCVLQCVGVKQRVGRVRSSKDRSEIQFQLGAQSHSAQRGMRGGGHLLPSVGGRRIGAGTGAWRGVAGKEVRQGCKEVEEAARRARGLRGDGASTGAEAQLPPGGPRVGRRCTEERGGRGGGIPQCARACEESRERCRRARDRQRHSGCRLALAHRSRPRAVGGRSSQQKKQHKPTPKTNPQQQTHKQTHTHKPTERRFFLCAP